MVHAYDSGCMRSHSHHDTQEEKGWGRRGGKHTEKEEGWGAAEKTRRFQF